MVVRSVFRNSKNRGALVAEPGLRPQREFERSSIHGRVLSLERAAFGAPTGDGVTTSTTGGTSIGVVRISGAKTFVFSTPIVTTLLGSNAAITSRDIVVDADARPVPDATVELTFGTMPAPGQEPPEPERRPRHWKRPQTRDC